MCCLGWPWLPSKEWASFNVAAAVTSWWCPCLGYRVYAAMNIVVPVSFCVIVCPEICPRVGVLGHMAALFLVFWGPSILFPIVAASTYIPTNSKGGFSFLHTLSSVCYCKLFNDGPSHWCEVVPHCSFPND